MLDWRIAHTGPPGTHPGIQPTGADPIVAWNEMILDGERLLESLKYYPATTIQAIVYYGDVGDKKNAQNMASEFQKKLNLTEPLPLIVVNTKVDVRDGKQ